MMATPPNVREVHCPVCRLYLGSIDSDGSYMRFPPCKCGWQWVGAKGSLRQRRAIETPGGSIEVKSR